MGAEPLPSWEECHRAGMTLKEAAAARGVDRATAYHYAARTGLTFKGQTRRAKLKRPDGDAGGAGNDGAPYDEPDWQSCYSLWAALLLDQIGCATRSRRATSQSKREDLEISKARSWMGGHDFRMVCSLLGLEHEKVMRHYLLRLAPAMDAERAKR